MLGWITKWISLERFGIWFIVTMEQESTSDYHSLESLVHHSSRLYLHWNECHSSCWSCWLWLLCTSQCASWGEMSLKKALCTSLNKVKTYLGTNTFILSNTKWKEIGAHHTVHAYLCMLQQSASNPAAVDTDRRSRGNVSDTWRLRCVDILLLLKKHQSRYRRQQLACSNAHNSLDFVLWPGFHPCRDSWKSRLSRSPFFPCCPHTGWSQHFLSKGRKYNEKNQKLIKLQFEIISLFLDANLFQC